MTWGWTMGDSMGLELGAQTAAARLVADAVPEVAASLESLGTAVQGSAAGFQGQSAAALAAALDGWFQVAARLPEVLAGYAADLAAVDRTAGASDARGASGLSAAGGAGGSGLTMGGPQ